MKQLDKSSNPSRAAECCTEPRCESGLRNNYFEGKRLTPDMFRVEQRYLNERRRLLNRAIHGYGVVYGYAIGVPASKYGERSQRSTRFAVNAGLALDACGRELLQVQPYDLGIDNVIALDKAGKAITFKELLSQPSYGHNAEEPVCALLSVHYAEQQIDRVTVGDPCRCEFHEWDHACETVRYSVRIVPCEHCCTECDCELHCDCGTGPCCGSEDDEDDEDDKDDKPEKTYKADEGEKGAAAGQASDGEKRECLPFKRGGCRCLCDHLATLDPGSDCGNGLREIEGPCARLMVDLAHGVPLACVRLVPDLCGGWTFGDEIDTCGPRRLVKRNDLLFDLIRGCDLTRIDGVSWKDWHRKDKDYQVPFEDFSAKFGAPAYGQNEYVTDFSVTFSRPVRLNTLLADCFAMTALSREREGNWLEVQRVPIVRLEPIPCEPDVPKHVRGAKVVVAGGWVEDALRGRATVFFSETWIEIEVRGDFILDCNGQPVDANAVGRSAVLTGNGTPGGTFLSTFLVAAREPYARPAARDAQDRAKGAAS